MIISAIAVTVSTHFRHSGPKLRFLDEKRGPSKKKKLCRISGGIIILLFVLTRHHHQLSMDDIKARRSSYKRSYSRGWLRCCCMMQQCGQQPAGASLFSCIIYYITGRNYRSPAVDCLSPGNHHKKKEAWEEV